MRMVKLSQNEVMYFYSEHKAKDFFPYVFQEFIFDIFNTITKYL